MKKPRRGESRQGFEMTVNTDQGINVMGKNITAAAAVTPATVDFHGHALTVITGPAGEHLVAMKPICEAIGLQWEAQLKRIKRHEVLNSTVSMMDMVAEDGKIRELVCLPLDYLNGWLFGVDASRVRPEIRSTLIKYQRECFGVLAAYWQQGEAVNPRKSRKPKALPNGLSLEQQDVIRGMVHDHVESLPMDKRKGAAIKCWSALKSKFGCGYKDISPEQFTEAVSLVARVVLEGEWLPKQKEGDFVISQRDALDICHLLHHAEWCVHRWNQDISKGVMALNQPLWSRTHEHFQEVERVGRGLERSMSEMIGHFRGRLGGLRPGESAGRSLTA